MNAFCKYHPNDAASWSCEHCKTHFCQSCVPIKQPTIYPKCTLCRRSLMSLSIVDEIPPLLSKLSFFFLLPIQTTLLIKLIIFSMIISVIPNNKIGIAVFIALMFPVSEFLFTIMEKVANGEPIKAEKKQWFSSEKKGFFIRLLFTYSFIVILISKTFIIFGNTVGYFLSAFFILGLPASMMILMMEKRFLSMINPVKIGYIIKLMGSVYFLLYLLVAIISATSFYFSSISQGQSQFLAEILSNGISFYLVIVLFSMMGYLIFQYHHELNYRVSSKNLQNSSASLKMNQDERMVEIDIFLQEGRFEDAQTILLEKIAINAMDYKANEKLITLYGIQGKDTYLSKIAEAYFKKLVEQEKVAQAADFYVTLAHKSIEYYPSEATLALLIAEGMCNAKQFKIALSLLNHYSDSPNGEQCWDEIAYLKARIYAEFSNENKKATKLLNLIIKRSVKQILLEKADKLLRIIKNNT